MDKAQAGVYLNTYKFNGIKRIYANVEKRLASGRKYVNFYIADNNEIHRISHEIATLLDLQQDRDTCAVKIPNIGYDVTQYIAERLDRIGIKFDVREL